MWEQNLITEETKTTRPNVFECEYVKSIENISIEKTDSEYIFENKNKRIKILMEKKDAASYAITRS